MSSPISASQPAPGQRMAVLGAGTWGITLAGVLAENGHDVACWDISAPLLAELDARRTHPKLEGYRVPASIRFEADFTTAVAGARGVVLVVPSQAMRAICTQLSALPTRPGDDPPAWVICSKGIEQQTRLLMHEVLADVMGPAAAARAGVLSGPSHAEEVSRGLPTTVVASAPDEGLAREIQRWFFRPYLRVYTCADVRGVELGASLKNVIAIAAGISDGLGFGDNTRAALMTRGLAEMTRLGIAAGAQRETFMGLSGIGDLIVTAGSRHSRNHRFGQLLAEGLSCDEALARVGMVVEGLPTARSAMQLSAHHGIEMPITEAVYKMCYEGVAPREAVAALLARDPKPELY